MKLETPFKKKTKTGQPQIFLKKLEDNGMKCLIHSRKKYNEPYGKELEMWRKEMEKWNAKYGIKKEEKPKTARRRSTSAKKSSVKKESPEVQAEAKNLKPKKDHQVKGPQAKSPQLKGPQVKSPQVEEENHQLLEQNMSKLRKDPRKVVV